PPDAQPPGPAAWQARGATGRGHHWPGRARAARRLWLRGAAAGPHRPAGAAALERRISRCLTRNGCGDKLPAGQRRW
nr:hypothetical protein [Tanacetum cinerariifolium]